MSKPLNAFQRLRLAVLALGLIVLGGCSITYNIAGEFEGGGQAFYGTVSVMIGDTGTIEVATLDGSLTCKGTSQVTKRPSEFTLVGVQGTATAKCNDGRTFKIDFIQTGESGGHGRGLDSQGKIVKLFFDKSEMAARSRMKINRLDAIIK